MENVIDINRAIAEPVFAITKDEAGSFVHQIDAVFHPGYVRGETEGAKRAKAGLEFITRELTNLNVGRVKLDPDHANQVKRGFDAIGTAITEARNALKSEAKRLTDSLIEKSNFKPDPVLTSLVVGTFQNLKPNERVEALGKLIEQNAGSSLAILDSVPTVFTGLTDELKATIRTRLFAKADPQAFKQLEDAQFNLERIELASIASANAGAKFHAPMHKAAAAPKEVHKSMIG